MDRDSLRAELQSIVEQYLVRQNLQLVDLIYRHEGRDLVARILVDRPEGGIFLDECSRINRELGVMLDEKNLIEQRYILEVSSPGLDRPLKNRNDFNRCLNQAVNLFLRDPVNGKIEWQGIIVGADDNQVVVLIQGQNTVFAFSNIIKAKQVIG